MAGREEEDAEEEMVDALNPGAAFDEAVLRVLARLLDALLLLRLLLLLLLLGWWCWWCWLPSPLPAVEVVLHGRGGMPPLREGASDARPPVADEWRRAPPRPLPTLLGVDERALRPLVEDDASTSSSAAAALAFPLPPQPAKLLLVRRLGAPPSLARAERVDRRVDASRGSSSGAISCGGSGLGLIASARDGRGRG